MMKIPKTWRDITLAIFEAAYKVEQDHYDDEIDRQIDWIAALTCSTREDVASMNLGDLGDLKRSLQWVTVPKFDKRIPKFFTAGGMLWEVNTEVDKLTAAQYAELCTWMKNDPMMNLDKVMASLVTRRNYWLFKSKYDGSTNDKRAQLFRKSLSMDIVYPVALFFFRVFTLSMQNIQASLEQRKTQSLKQLMKEVLKVTGNQKHLTHS